MDAQNQKFRLDLRAYLQHLRSDIDAKGLSLQQMLEILKEM